MNEIKMTPELYKTIVTIVDERVKQIKVTREDFNELKGVVLDLAHSQKELAQAQKETQHELRHLARAVGGLSDTIGFGLEDIARVVLPSYLKNHYFLELKRFKRKIFIS